MCATAARIFPITVPIPEFSVIFPKPPSLPPYLLSQGICSLPLAVLDFLNAIASVREIGSSPILPTQINPKTAHRRVDRFSADVCILRIQGSRQNQGQSYSPKFRAQRRRIVKSSGPSQNPNSPSKPKESPVTALTPH